MFFFPYLFSLLGVRKKP